MTIIFLNDRSGINICDVTSYVFTDHIPWKKLDAIAFSWQKGLGSEAAHGMLVLSPKAIDKLNTYKPKWSVPYLFKLHNDNDKINTLLFNQGYTINTPSMMCVADCLLALNWAKKLGGISALRQKTQNNFNVINNWVKEHSWIDFVATDSKSISQSTVCLKIIEESFLKLKKQGKWSLLQGMADFLEKYKVAYDILNHTGSKIPSIRIWCGPTVEASDIKKLLPWISESYKNSKDF